MILLEVQSSRVIDCCGLSELGYYGSFESTEKGVIEMVHPNQRKLLQLQTHRVYEVFARRPNLIKGKGVVYCCAFGRD